MAGLYGTRRAGERDEGEYRAAAVEASGLTGMSPAYRGSDVPYFQSVRDAGLEGAQAQTVLHYGIRRQMALDVLRARSAEENRLYRYVELGARGDRDRFNREMARDRLGLAKTGQEQSLKFNERRLELDEAGMKRAKSRDEFERDWNKRKFGVELRGRYSPESVARYEASGALGDLEERPESTSQFAMVKGGIDPASIAEYRRTGDVASLRRLPKETAGRAKGRPFDAGLYRLAARKAGGT